MNYPPGTVKALLDTDFVTSSTANALRDRMQKESSGHSFFDENNFALLSVVCDRLVAQDPENRLVNIALFIDERLKENTGDGWRYNTMPPDGQMYLNGLKGIGETAELMFNENFLHLSEHQQLDVLHSIQNGKAPGAAWKEMPSATFFEELLAETTEVFYSYPIVQEEIGYVGMADAKGWTRIGLDEKEAIEIDALQNNTTKK